jgi:hypothetical protein
MNDALRRLRDRGAVLVEMEVENAQALNSAVSLPVGAFDIRNDLPRYLADNNTGVCLPGPSVRM